MPNSTVRYGSQTCTYYSRIGSPETRCRVDTNYSDRTYHTHCLGCGQQVALTPVVTDPQVLLDQVRAALNETASKVREVRTLLGRPQTARSTLARVNEALAAVDACADRVVSA